MSAKLNNVILKLPKRAEVSAPAKLIQTFVDVGPLVSLLTAHDHQVLFGRRGTGKTHALSYLAEVKTQAGDAVVFIDMRNIGSNGGLYGDERRSLGERATGLLVDCLSAIHEGLLTFALNQLDGKSLVGVGPALDRLADAITQVEVVGQVEVAESTEVATADESNLAGKITIATKASSATAEIGSKASDSARASKTSKRSGSERLHVNFGATGAAFRLVAEGLSPKRLWVLFDEWSSVPIQLQPYLADLLRRTLLPVTGVTVKIGAIEPRSQFQAKQEGGDYIGIELGADVSGDLNLDDFMVFDNDAERATSFYVDLIGRHVISILKEVYPDEPPPEDAASIAKKIFTEKRAIEEFVRSCEGVPRDAINILALAAQRAFESEIAVQHIRIAARNWYQRDKEKSVSSNIEAHELLHWLIDNVIGKRRARAFLLESSALDSIVESLYDSRVIHILKRGVSTHDQPGVRFDVYKLDYGCYVDLISTTKVPLGLLPVDAMDEFKASFIEVPPDDYRSIRGAILSLHAFRSRNSQ